MLASAATFITIAVVGDFMNESRYILLIGMLSAWWVKTIENKEVST